jgi:dTDP-D-glucose 4,6-dehydratase
VDPEAPCNLTW